LSIHSNPSSRANSPLVLRGSPSARSLACLRCCVVCLRLPCRARPHVPSGEGTRVACGAREVAMRRRFAQTRWSALERNGGRRWKRIGPRNT
jgi:hypothetical protein